MWKRPILVIPHALTGFQSSFGDRNVKFVPPKIKSKSLIGTFAKCRPTLADDWGKWSARFIFLLAVS